MISHYPEYKEGWCFPAEEQEVENIKEAVRAIRALRSDMDVPPSKKAAVYVVSEQESVRASFEACEKIVRVLGNASALHTQADKSGIGADAVSTVVSTAALYIPLEDLVDIGKEKERLQKEIARLEGEVKRSNGMLQNEKFLAKAPQQKIDDEKEKLAKYEEMLAKVRERFAALG